MDQPMQAVLNFDGLPDEIDLDGYVDDVGIGYVGKARRQPGGKYLVLANVGGCLCRVEVRLRLAEKPGS